MDEPEGKPNPMTGADNGADRAAPSGEPSEIIAGLERAYDAVIRLAAGEEFRMSIPTRPEDHDILIAGAISDALDYLRATPAEPGASPPSAEALWEALADQHGVDDEGQLKSPPTESDLYDAWYVAARSPAPAGDAPRKDALRWALDAVEAEPELPGEMPREMAAALATLTTEEEWSEVLRATVRATKDSIANRLRGAVSPSPGTRAASEGEA
jgi:hypothetical protein